MGTELPNDRNKMPDEDAHFDNWFESAVPPEPYTEQHLRWAFNAGGMVQRLLTSQSEDAPTGEITELLFIQAAANVMKYRNLGTETLRAFCKEIGVEILMKPKPRRTQQASGDVELRSLLRVILDRGDFYSPGHSDEECIRAVRRAKELLDG